jgi:hypothetical protein
MRWQFSDLNTPQGIIRLGRHVLAASYNTLATEKLRNTRSMQYGIKTSWPEMLIEFSDLVSHSIPTNSRRHYTAEEIRNADFVCTIFVSLPYTRDTKKLVLVRARSDMCWRELAPIFGLTWAECRRQCDTVYIHLCQAASLCPYKATARQVRERQRYALFAPVSIGG